MGIRKHNYYRNSIRPKQGWLQQLLRLIIANFAKAFSEPCVWGWNSSCRHWRDLSTIVVQKVWLLSPLFIRNNSIQSWGYVVFKMLKVATRFYLIRWLTGMFWRLFVYLLLFTLPHLIVWTLRRLTLHA